MSIPLARILARRPKSASAGDEWIGLSSLPPTTLAIEREGGSWRVASVPLPAPVDDGICLGLRRTLVARSDRFWEPGMASVWEVLACQEDADLVPGVPVFVDPHPPCLLCGPCVAGHHAQCLEARVRRWSPGWLSRETVVPPWTLRRGLLELPPRVGERANLFLDGLSRIRHALVPLARNRPRRIAVVGSDLAAVLTGLVLERLLPDAERTWIRDGGEESRGGESWGFQKTLPLAGTGEEYDLVVGTDGAPEAVTAAYRTLGPEGHVVFLAPPDSEVVPLEFAALWGRGGSVHVAVGCSPDDRVAVVAWLTDLAGRLETLPVAELPFDQAAEAQNMLRDRPDLLGVELVSPLRSGA